MSKRMIHVAERRLVNFYFIFSIFLFCLLWKKRRRSTSVSPLVSFELQQSLFPSGGRIPDIVFRKFSLLCFQRALYRTKNPCWQIPTFGKLYCLRAWCNEDGLSCFNWRFAGLNNRFFLVAYFASMRLFLCFHLKFARTTAALPAKNWSPCTCPTIDRCVINGSYPELSPRFQLVDDWTPLWVCCCNPASNSTGHRTVCGRVFAQLQLPLK